MRGTGFRLRPSVKFLIEVLQYKAAGGEDLSAATEVPGDLCCLDLYGPGKEPWNVFSGENEIWELHDSNKRKLKEKYVVTKLNKIGKKKVSRTAGSGAWDDQSMVKSVEYGGNVMGYMRTLTYEYCGDAEVSNKCYYYMHEYHLSKHSLEEVELLSTDYVICRIIKNEAKGCRIKFNKKRKRLCQDDDLTVSCLISQGAEQDLSVEQKIQNHNFVKPDFPVESYNSVKSDPQLDGIKDCFQENNINPGVIDHNGYYFPNQAVQEQNPGVIDQGYYYPHPVVQQDVYDPNFCGFSGQDSCNVASFCSDYPEMDFLDQGNCIPSSSSSEFLDRIDFSETCNCEQWMNPEFMNFHGEQRVSENQFCSYP